MSLEIEIFAIFYQQKLQKPFTNAKMCGIIGPYFSSLTVFNLQNGKFDIELRRKYHEQSI
jgi:hypothetical protein